MVRFIDCMHRQCVHCFPLTEQKSCRICELNHGSTSCGYVFIRVKKIIKNAHDWLGFPDTFTAHQVETWVVKQFGMLGPHLQPYLCSIESKSISNRKSLACHVKEYPTDHLTLCHASESIVRGVKEWSLKMIYVRVKILMNHCGVKQVLWKDVVKGLKWWIPNYTLSSELLEKCSKLVNK